MDNIYDDLIEMPDGTYRAQTENAIVRTGRATLYKPVGRATKKTSAAMSKVIEVLAKGGSITDASKVIDISPSTLSNWRKIDAEFDTACKEACDVFTDKIEDVFYDRVLNGTEQKIYDDTGNIVQTRIVHDNTLLVKALAARRPETWGNQTRKVEISGKDGGAINVVTIDLNKAAEEIAKYQHSFLATEYSALLDHDRKLREDK